MAIDSVAHFIDAIRQNQLLEAGQLSELVAEARKSNDPRQAAQFLIKRNWLTPYQVNQVFQGQAGSLVLGQYRILERLGEGGMGQVFKARHQAMGRIVALKVIRKELLENAAAAKRFRREIEAAARLHHPNVVIAFDADSVGGTHFFAMEYVDGADLAQVVRQTGPLPVAVACDYVRQAALGLQHAHERGLIHRDIKPGNLLVARVEAPANGAQAAARRSMAGGPKPVIKILDMGLARSTFLEAEATGASISQHGSVMGTPDYMAPEQAKNARAVDHRADIYSLGCTFYFLLTGQVPFPGGTNMDKLIRHQMDQPPPVEKFRPELSPRVRAILHGMMAKRPEERIQSAGEVADALAPFCSGPAGIKITQKMKVIPSKPVGSTTSMLRSVFALQTIRRHRKLAFVLAAAVFLGLTGMLFVVLSLLPGGGTRKPGTLEPVAAYLPDSAAKVFIYDVADIVRTPIYRQYDAAIRQQLSSQRALLEQHGIDLFADVDRAVSVWSPDAGDFYYLLQGNFDPKKYQDGLTKLSARLKGSRSAPYYEYPPAASPTGRPAFVAMPSNHVFLYTSNEQHLVNVLPKRPATLADKEVQRFVESLDDKSSIHLVIGGSFMLRGVPLSDNLGARAITLSCQLGDDVAAEYSVFARDGQRYRQLRADNGQFVRDFLSTNVDTTGMLPRAIAGATMATSDANNRITFQVHYGTTEIARFLKR